MSFYAFFLDFWVIRFRALVITHFGINYIRSYGNTVTLH